MGDGRFGRLTLESSAQEVLAVLSEPPDFVRQRARPGVWSVLWQYGALEVGFAQRSSHGLFLDEVHVEFEGRAVPEALGLDLAPLGDETTLGEFERLAGEHDVELRDVTPDALRGPYVWLAGPGDVHAGFHEGRLYSFGT